MDAAELEQRAQVFSRQLQQIKNDLAPAEFGWYPYGTLDNFHILNRLLTGANRRFLDGIGEGLVADIGAADGDVAFFLESLGHRVHVVDYAPTNFNGCRGARLLKQHLNSNVEITETDIDTRLDLPAQRYELAFFLGILYHLKNPYLALESLAKRARHAFVSTRITRFNVAKGSEGREVNRRRVE